MKYYRVVYSQEASSDLMIIQCYIANEMREPTIAGNLVNKLTNAIDSLSTLPFRHQRLELASRSKEERRQFVTNGYIVIYDINENTNTIYIIRVMNCRRNKNTTVSKN